jgi:hypothetical protein
MRQKLENNGQQYDEKDAEGKNDVEALGKQGQNRPARPYSGGGKGNVGGEFSVPEIIARALTDQHPSQKQQAHLSAVYEYPEGRAVEGDLEILSCRLPDELSDIPVPAVQQKHPGRQNRQAEGYLLESPSFFAGKQLVE